MVLVDPKVKPVASMVFEAEILVLHHPTTIKPNYQAMLHIGSVRQTATLVSMGKVFLKNYFSVKTTEIGLKNDLKNQFLSF